MAIQKKTYIDFLGMPEPEVHLSYLTQETAVAAGTDARANQWTFANGSALECWMGDASAHIVPVTVAGVGLDIPLDEADNDQVQLIVADSINSTGPCYTIGTDAAFRVDVKFLLEDVTDLDVCAVGFRKQAAFVEDLQTNAAWKAAYDDMAAISIDGTSATSPIRIYHSLNGSDAEVDTTDTFADAATKTFSVLVSSAGVVTYLIDGTAPTVTLAQTFDDGDVVIPFFEAIMQATGSAGHRPCLVSWFSGHQ